MAEPSPEDRSDSLSVPWVDAVRFIRQLSHDLRNHLNAIELQSAYVSELEGDAKLKGEVNRLREMISGLTSVLQEVSGGLGEVKPNLISYRASDFVEDLRKKIAQEFPNRWRRDQLGRPAGRCGPEYRSSTFAGSHRRAVCQRIPARPRQRCACCGGEDRQKTIPLYATGAKNPI